ncbi:MAG: HD domain-containing phosphohydrolase [bacterium]
MSKKIITNEHVDKVLVVDDEKNICKVCYDSLSNAGYEVETTSNPNTAIKKFSRNPFDLVLTDIKMPQINGLKLVQKLKTISPDLPVVVMTGYATLETAVKAVNEGVSNFVRKPFSLEELLSAVKNALERRQLIRENIRLKTLVNFFMHSDEISSVHEPSKIYTLLLNSAIKETKADRGGIFEIDSETGQIYLRYGVNLEGFIEKEICFQQHLGLAGQILKMQSPVIIESWDNVGADYKSIGEEKWSKTCIGVPLKCNGSVKNVLCLYKTESQFSDADVDGAVILATQACIALKNSDLVLELEIFFLETMKSLAKTLDERDPYTHGHSKRVAQVAVAIGKVMGLSENKLEELALAGNLHDIGKIGIPDSIIFKAGSLTPKEYEIIKTHAEKGFNILKHIKRLSSISEAVYSHHEWHNGQGYPRGLKNDEIPLAGAIIAVADAFDTIVTDRHYRKKRCYIEALQILEERAGKQFNPTVVQALGQVNLKEMPLI